MNFSALPWLIPMWNSPLNTMMKRSIICLLTNLKQRIVHLFGKAINQNLTNIDTETSIVKISGFIGKPEHARRTPGEQFFFINNRFMKHPYFHRAVMNAYEKILPPETIPSYFIFLEADPDTIDINIHPTKTEIKFENELAIFQILIAATREALGRFNLLPSIDFNAEGAIEFPVFRRDEPVPFRKFLITATIIRLMKR